MSEPGDSLWLCKHSKSYGRSKNEGYLGVTCNCWRVNKCIKVYIRVRISPDEVCAGVHIYPCFPVFGLLQKRLSHAHIEHKTSPGLQIDSKNKWKLKTEQIMSKKSLQKEAKFTKNNIKYRK